MPSQTVCSRATVAKRPQTAGYPADCTWCRLSNVMRPSLPILSWRHLSMGLSESKDHRFLLLRRPTLPLASCPRKRMPLVLHQVLTGHVSNRRQGGFPSALCFPSHCSKCHHCSAAHPLSPNLSVASSLPATLYSTQPSRSRAPCAGGGTS